MIKMARMTPRILLSLPFVIAFPALTALAAPPPFAINDFRARIQGLPPGNILQTTRFGSPENCLATLEQYQHDVPRRPAPWIAYMAQAACALAAGDKAAALGFADAGLKLRGSSSDLLILKAQATEPATSEPNVQSLTEALVFDRFEVGSRLNTLLLLIQMLTDLGQPGRAVSLLERWVEREPAAAATLIETYTIVGNRPRALEFSQKLITERGNQPDLLRARARALLLPTDRVLFRVDFTEALRCMEKIEAPLSTGDLMLKAQIFLKLNRPEDALVVLDQIADAPTTPTGLQAAAIHEQAEQELAAQK